MNFFLEKAIKIAVDAHLGQRDKSDEPYIFHPLRVMNSVDSYEEKIVAILHDVVEDTDLTFDDLIEYNIPEQLIVALRLLTRNDNTSYEDYITKIAENPLASKVKLADLEDNMNVARLKEIGVEDVERLNKYLRSYNFLKTCFSC